MSDLKYGDKENFSAESLDSNMKQIETTNNIINNLESQLNDFFIKKSSGGYNNYQSNHNHQEMVLQISSYSPNMKGSPNKQNEDNYQSSMNQQSSNTTIMNKKQQISDYAQNIYGERGASSSKKQYNFQGDMDSEEINSDDDNKNEQFINKGLIRNKNQEYGHENDDLDVKVNDHQLNNIFSNGDMQRLKDKYLNKNYQSNNELQVIQEDQQDENGYYYKNYKSEQGAFNIKNNQIQQQQQQVPLFQNKNLMQHFQQSVQQVGINEQYSQQQNLQSQLLYLQQQQQQQLQLQDDLKQNNQLKQQQFSSQINQKDITNEDAIDNSQSFRGDASHGRGNKSMLDNSVISVKNKDELENELIQLQKRLNQLDQESTARRNNLDQTSFSPSKASQQYQYSTVQQTNRGFNSIGEISSINNNSTIVQTQKQTTTATTNREQIPQNYQNGSSRSNSMVQNNQNNSSMLPSTFSTRGTDSIVSKLQKMEEFYQNRTRILEERINSLESENQNLLKTNNELAQQNEQLQQKLIIQKEQFMMEIQQKLKEQELRLNTEFEMNLNRFSNKNQEFLSQQLEEKHAYQKELDQIKTERQNLMKELDDLRKNNTELVDERDNINQSYSNLLAVHNQMLQIDIQKNERSLHHSFCQSTYSDRNSKPAANPNQFIFPQSQINDSKIESQQIIQDKRYNFNSNNSQCQSIRGNDQQKQKEELNQNEWREELSKLKEELEIEKRQRDKLESELRSQNIQHQEKSLQEDNQEINSLYQKIFMTRELKVREIEKQNDESSLQQKGIKIDQNNQEIVQEQEKEDEFQQSEYEDRQFAPRFMQNEKERTENKSVQFEERNRYSTIFKNESINNNIPKNSIQNLKVRGQDERGYKSTNIQENQKRSSSQSQKEGIKVNNQYVNQQKPPKTGGLLVSTPQSKKQTKEAQSSRDNSLKQYNQNSSQQHLMKSVSLENYNIASYDTNESQQNLNSKYTQEHVNDKKMVKQFIKEIDKLKKVILQKKKKTPLPHNSNQPQQNTKEQLLTQERKSGRTNNDQQMQATATKKSVKTPISSSKKGATTTTLEANVKRSNIRSNSANKHHF